MKPAPKYGPPKKHIAHFYGWLLCVTLAWLLIMLLHRWLGYWTIVFVIPLIGPLANAIREYIDSRLQQ